MPWEKLWQGGEASPQHPCAIPSASPSTGRHEWHGVQHREEKRELMTQRSHGDVEQEQLPFSLHDIPSLVPLVLETAIWTKKWSPPPVPKHSLGWWIPALWGSNSSAQTQWLGTAGRESPAPEPRLCSKLQHNNPEWPVDHLSSCVHRKAARGW